jgi:hypothetical protein
MAFFGSVQYTAANLDLTKGLNIGPYEVLITGQGDVASEKQ